MPELDPEPGVIVRHDRLSRIVHRMRLRPVLAGIAMAFTPGFNVSNVGAVADEVSHSYGVGLAVVGLFTTALFVTHAAMQVPAGRLSDRFGPRLVGGAGLAIVAVAS